MPAQGAAADAGDALVATRSLLSGPVPDGPRTWGALS